MSILTKIIVSKAVALGVLLYAVETWPIEQREVHSLKVFHHHCFRTILGTGISRAQQIAQHISDNNVRGKMGMPVPLVILFPVVGFTGCDSRLPKKILFGWLPQCQPPHGRWQDRVRQDLKCFHIDESVWFVVAQSRDWWSQLCVPSPSLSVPVQPQLFCGQCNRFFRRLQDMARHRCDSIRSRQTAGSSNSVIVCSICHKSFK